MIAFPPCPRCDGSGETVWRSGNDSGSATTPPPTYRKEPCPECGGLGVLITPELVGEGFEYLRRVGWTVPREVVRGLLAVVVEKLKENR